MPRGFSLDEPSSAKTPPNTIQMIAKVYNLVTHSIYRTVLQMKRSELKFQVRVEIWRRNQGVGLFTTY